MISVASFIACVLAMTGSWLVAKGQLLPVYWIGIINGLLYTGINVGIALTVGLEGVLFLTIPAIWGVAMAIKGLRRLKEEEGVGVEPTRPTRG